MNRKANFLAWLVAAAATYMSVRTGFAHNWDALFGWAALGVVELGIATAPAERRVTSSR